MKLMTGRTYTTGKYIKPLVVADNKHGKSCGIIGNLLGVMPWQLHGGLVTSPEHLHVITVDENALGGTMRFLKESCGAPDDALDFNVYSLQDDYQEVSSRNGDYDPTFYNALLAAIDAAQAKAKALGGVNAVMLSSLTGAASGIERGVSGPPSGKSNMDQNKWGQLGQMLNEIQHRMQRPVWHCFWEAHISKAISKDKDARGQAVEKDGIAVKGSSGKSWGVNCSHIFRLRRFEGQRHEGSKCDRVVFDTRAVADFQLGGRGVNEALDAQEPCMTLLTHKLQLGYQIGGWNAKEALPSTAVLQLVPEQAATTRPGGLRRKA